MTLCTDFSSLGHDVQEEAGSPGDRRTQPSSLSPSSPGAHLGSPLGLILLFANHLPVFYLQST